MRARSDRGFDVHRRLGVVLTAAVVGLPSLAFAAQGPRATPELGEASERLVDGGRPILLRDVQIIDGTGARPVAHGWILIDKGRISSMGAGRAPSAANADVFDLPGRSVYPGLSEMHAHIGRPAQAKWMLKLLLANGITNVKVAGNWADAATGLHHDVANRAWLRDDAITPHVYMSGTTMGGIPAPASPTHKTDYLPAGPKIQKFLDDNIAIGVDFFKIYDSVEPDALSQASAVAKQHDIILTGHIPDALNITEAVDHGLVVIEHLFIRPRDVTDAPNPPRDVWTVTDLESAPVRRTLDDWEKRKDTFFIDPTSAFTNAIAVQGELRPAWPQTESDRIISPAMLRQRAAKQNPGARPAPAQPPADADKAAAQRALHTRNVFVAMAYRRGVRVLTGTDMPLGLMAPGESLLQEIDLLVDGGLTPVEAIHASTGVAAEALRRRDRGLIARGQVADLVIVKGDVASDIRVTRNVELVILGGRVLDPKVLFDDARELAAKDTADLLPGEP